MNRKERTAELTYQAARRFIKMRFSINLELGLCKRGRLRADLLCMNSKGQFIIVEVKSCVADFLSDSKCDKYLQYCDKFYFCFMGNTWAKLKDRVKFPPQVGVLVYSSAGLKALNNSKNTPMSEALRQQLILRMAYRNGKFTSFKHVNAWRRLHTFV